MEKSGNIIKILKKLEPGKSVTFPRWSSLQDVPYKVIERYRWELPKDKRIKEVKRVTGYVDKPYFQTATYIFELVDGIIKCTRSVVQERPINKVPIKLRVGGKDLPTFIYH